MNIQDRILLVHLFSNGDCLFATTVAHQIKHDYPGCILTWAISKKCKSIINNNPHVDEVLEIDIADASQNLAVFEQVLYDANRKKQQGVYTQVFVSQVLGDNFSMYDGIVCTSIYRCFGKPITVDTDPVLYLTEAEQQKAKDFAIENNLAAYQNVVLFECAPQSNQLNLTDQVILQYCIDIIGQSNTCIILSAPKKYGFGHPQIIDGNSLSIRETVALTHYCTILLGCSSGISWAATSIAAKKIPMVQILTTNTYIFNPISITWKRLGKSTGNLIELTNFNSDKLRACFSDIFNQGFSYSREKHNQAVKKQYKLYRGIVHDFLAKRKFALIMKFIKINIKENGYDFRMMKFIIAGFVLFPVQYFLNKKKDIK